MLLAPNHSLYFKRLDNIILTKTLSSFFLLALLQTILLNQAMHIINYKVNRNVRSKILSKVFTNTITNHLIDLFIFQWQYKVNDTISVFIEEDRNPNMIFEMSTMYRAMVPFLKQCVYTIRIKLICIYVAIFLLYIKYTGIWPKSKFKMLISKLVWISLRKSNHKSSKKKTGFEYYLKNVFLEFGCWNLSTP